MVRWSLRHDRERDDGTERSQPPTHHQHHPARVVAAVLAVLLVAIACAIGGWAYGTERAQRDTTYSSGPLASPDRIVVEAAVKRVDAAADDLVIRVLVVPEGALAEPNSALAPAQDLVVEGTSLTKGALSFPAGQRIAAQDLNFGLDSGQIADYPFDEYSALVAFGATSGGKPVPVELRLVDTDPFFTSRTADADRGADGIAGFQLSLYRTRVTRVLASLMFLSMWALSLSALVGAVVIARRHMGLPWPALGWLAATLFALAGFRGTAPGAPPIGCLLDYTAFLWAEVIVTVSVVVVILWGTPVELARRTPAATEPAKQPPPAPSSEPPPGPPPA